MSTKHFPGATHSTLLGLVGAAVLFCPARCHGESPRPSATRRACAVSYEKAQQLRQASKLRAAKEVLTSCAKSACGDLQRECANGLSLTESEMPSIVLLAKNEAGLPIQDVQITMDGEPLTARLDSRAISVDPGTHDFAFQASTGAIVQKRFSIAKGERNRAVSVEFSAAATRAAKLSAAPSPATPSPAAKLSAAPSLAAPSPAAPRSAAPSSAAPSSAASPGETTAVSPGLQLKTAPPDEPEETGQKSSESVLPYVVGGVGAVGIGGYALLYSIAKGENGTLLSQCWPSCSPDRLDSVRHMYVAANVSLGVGIAALATAAYLFLQPDSRREKAAPQAGSYAVNVAPSHSGIYASVSGAF